MNFAAALAANLDQPLTPVERRRFAGHLLSRRARQSETLNLYEPMALQEQFHASRAYIRLFVGGNRCGKSVATAVEFARMVTQRDPHGKYPPAGKSYVVGKSLKHVSDTIFPMLFRPGLFKIIRDTVTGTWRTYRPWDPADRARKDDALPAPPLIPERYIAKIAWRSKQKQEVELIRFTTGWEVLFFSAEGRLPQGSKVDHVWFDEEIPRSSDGPWFPEMSARLIDNAGVLVWSAAPQHGYDELLGLFERGEAQHAKYRLDPVKYPKPDIDVFKTSQDDNVYLGAAEKVRFLTNLSDEDALVRVSGEFTVASRLMYPEFGLAAHGLPREPTIPVHWTRYAAVDPGHAVCAVLLAACPPPEECPNNLPMVVAYKELYLQQANAAIFGAAMKDAIGDQDFEDFIIDMQGARPTEMGSGQTVYEQYEAALRRNNVFSRRSGHGFTAGSPDLSGGVLMVHDWLRTRKDNDVVGPPRFRFLATPDGTASMLPTLYYEMRRYPKQVIAGRVLDKPNDRGPTHLCQCVRYLCMYGPEFVAVKTKRSARTTVRDFMNQLIADQGGGHGAFVSFGRRA